MLFYLVIAIFLSMVLVVIRGLRGPTVYDRVLAANAFGSKTMVLIILLAMVSHAPRLLDIALIYGMINFITTIGFLEYIGKAARDKS